MKGKIAKAASNATFQSISGGDLSEIHLWRNDERSHESSIQAFEMKFEKPTSLVSLNLDITFECTDSKKLIHCIKPEIQSQLVDKPSQDKEAKTEEMSTQTQITTTEQPVAQSA